MKILIGIQNTSTGGCYHGAEGFEGFSLSASTVSILASGTDAELKALVKKAKENRENRKKELSALMDRIQDFNESLDADFDYDEECEKIDKKYPEESMLTTEYDQLIIVEGELL